MHNLIKAFLYRICFFMLLFAAQNSNAQNIIPLNKGGSSLTLNPSFKETAKDSAKNDPTRIDTVSFGLGMISFSTTDKKIDFNYYNLFTPKNGHYFFVGVAASGEIKNSFATLFANKNIVSGAEAKLRFGYQLFSKTEDWDKLIGTKRNADVIEDLMANYTKPKSDLWAVLNVGFSGSSFKLFFPDSTFASQIQKTPFTGIDVSAGFNYWSAKFAYSTFLAGATIGIKRTNNFDDLDETTRQDVRTISDPTTSTNRTITLKETVYSGKYKETTVYPLNFDFYFVPHKLENIAFLAFSKTDISKTDKPKTRLGFGIYFLKNQNAFNPLAGLVFDYGDVFNVDKSDDYKKSINKFRIGISTRVAILSNRKRS